MKAHIALQENVKPVYQKAMPVLYALKQPVEQKLISLKHKEY